MLKASVTRVGLNEKTRTPVIILDVEDSRGVLPIAVGKAEARAIALALKGVEPPRPIAYDLIRSIIERLDTFVERVRITTLRQGTFYAELDISREGRYFSLDCRPSDAIALALRVGAPIYISESVADQALVQETLIDTEGSERERKRKEAVEEERRKFREFLEQVRAEDFGSLDEFE